MTIRVVLHSFLGKFGPKKSKLSALTENWYTWYLGSADSESGLRFLKFRPQNSFLGKFGPKKSKLSVFPENWHAWHLDDADSYSNISFLNFHPKSIVGQIWTKKVKKFFQFGWKLAHSISTMLILILTLFFSASNPKSSFGQIWAKKLKVVHFDWKLAHMIYHEGRWFFFQQ